MIDVLIALTGLTIAVAMVQAYRMSRDPLHPLMYMGPLFFYIYVFIPLSLSRQNLLEPNYPDAGALALVLTIVGAGILLFCVGCLQAKLPRTVLPYIRRPMDFGPLVRRRLRLLSYVLAGLGLLAYLYALSLGGGLFSAYSRIKGGGWTPSGYISEAPLLTLPAILIYLLSRRHTRLNMQSVLLVLLFASPHLLQGILGARRGPAFLAFTAMGFGYYLSKAKRPPLRLVIAGVGVVGLLMVFLVSQRKEIYIGSEFDFDQTRFSEALVPTQLNASQTTVASWDAILTAHHLHQHYWGRRYFVQLLVRPIPKQVWPTKYEDMGMSWMTAESGRGGLTADEWRSATGRSPERGSAIAFVADAYLEFSYLGLLLCFLIGRVYGYLWKKGILLGGIWSVLYLEAAVVSVYVPTQGIISAWLYRFLYLAVPSWFLWRWLVPSVRTSRFRPAATGFAPPTSRNPRRY